MVFFFFHFLESEAVQGECSAATVHVCVGGLCGGGVQHIKTNQGWQIDFDEQNQKKKEKTTPTFPSL